jgi:adenine deaminase
LKRFGVLSTADSAEARAVTEVALGKAAADLAVVNARLLNVYTGEILPDTAVAVKGPWIAWVGTDPGGRIAGSTRVVDAGGAVLTPGFIDGHTHLADMLYPPWEFIRHAVPGGTTAVVTETVEPYPMLGLAGIQDFLAALEDQPVTFFATAPPVVSTSRAVNGIREEDLAALLERDDVVGLGEVYWSNALREPDTFLPLMRRTLLAGKSVEGHTAGARGGRLMAYTALGVSSCHEPIQASEVLERLRLGLRVMIREGSIRRDLEEIAAIRDQVADMSRLMLVTDGVGPTDLLEGGYMDRVVQKAVNCGFEPAQAVRMATLNVADHFGLGGLLGGIAPGRQADMLLLPEPEIIRPRLVIARGRVVAEAGRLTVPPRKHAFSEASRNSILLSDDLNASAFAVKVPGGGRTARVRVIHQVTGLVTRELLETVELRDGEIRHDPDRDLLKAAAVDRARTPGRMFVGLIHGFGLKAGAFACSSGWDTPNIMVVGAQDQDMAAAVNRIRRLRGGAVVCVNGEVRAELPMPILGLMSDRPLEEIADGMRSLVHTLQGLGCPFEDPYRTLATLSGAAIPFIRICEEGLVDLKSGRSLPLLTA